MNGIYTEMNYSKNATKSVVNQVLEDKYIYRCQHDPLPTASDILRSMNTEDVIYHVVLVVLSTAIIGMFVEQVFYLKSNIKSSYRRRLAIIQAGIPPVFAFSSIMGTFFPGGYVMIDFVSSVYFGFALHAFLVLMVNYYGGLRQLLLTFEGKSIKINTGPFCCCCLCLPSFKMTKKTFLILWYATFQAAFMRPIVLFFEGVLQSDQSLNIPGLVYSSFLIFSTLIGMWSLVIFRNASGEMLSKYRITAKFFNFQIVLLISNLQPFIIKLCHIPCHLPYTYIARKLTLNYEIMIIEFFILSLITRFLYRRSSDNSNLDPIDKTPKHLEKNIEIEKMTIKSVVNDGDSASSYDNDSRIDILV